MQLNRRQRAGDALYPPWPLLAASTIFAVVFALQLWQILRLTHARQLYPLDDVYIHAAVAKNLVLHHVYGVNRFQVSFPSSSILWPFVLAFAFALVGVEAWVPLSLNFLFALVYLATADRFLRVLAPSISSRMRFACLLLLTFGMPLIGLSFEGMEHVLHALAFLLLLYCYHRVQFFPGRFWRPLFVASAAFAVSLRYESLFAILIIGCLLLWQREWVLTAAVGFAALVPVLAFGIFSTLHGSTFLPPPLLLKTSASSQFSMLTAAKVLFSSYSLLAGVSLCFFLTAAFLLYFLRGGNRQALALRHLLTILFGTFVLHLQLAHLGWLFRYEAYLLSTCIVLVFAAAAIVLADEHRVAVSARRPLTIGLIALLAIGLAGRGASMLRGIPRNAQAIYQQQYQTARFLAAYYPGQVIGLNDIGAPDFFADIRSVDLLGLASSDVARLRRNGLFSRKSVAALAQQRSIRVAVLYPNLFINQIPYDWIPVSSFDVTDIPGRVQLGERRVMFYATTPSEADQLAQHIQQFRSQLPEGVRVGDPGSPEPPEATVNRRAWAP